MPDSIHDGAWGWRLPCSSSRNRRGFAGFLRPGRSMAHLCMAIAIASIACRPVDQNAMPIGQVLDDAWESYRQGDTLQARAILAEAARAHPAEPALPYDLALVELIEGEPSKALTTLDEAARRASLGMLTNPAENTLMTARIAAARGYGLIMEGRWGEAAKSLELALAENALTPKEKADAQANLRFAEARGEADPKERKPDEPAGPDRLSQRAGPSLANETEQRPTPDEQWKKLADDVRARARVARSQFEPAGDELRGPAAAPIDKSVIDW